MDGGWTEDAQRCEDSNIPPSQLLVLMDSSVQPVPHLSQVCPTSVPGLSQVCRLSQVCLRSVWRSSTTAKVAVLGSAALEQLLFNPVLI